MFETNRYQFPDTLGDGGDYMILVCRDEILTRPARTDFTQITWGNQISSRRGGAVFHLVFV